MNDPTLGITLRLIWGKLEDMDKRLRKIEVFNTPSDESLKATQKIMEKQSLGEKPE